MINENKNHIKKILITKNLLPFIHNDTETFNINKILHQTIIVPKNKHINQILKKFHSQRYHITIVIDEFNKISNLMTIKNILKLIINEIKNKYNEKNNIDFHQLNRHT